MPTALIVEDEPEANKLLAMLVQIRGYRTVSAFTGGEALARVDDEHPDVVFLDLMLPDVNGYDVCRSIKSRRDTALIPVVMVTARVAVENRIQSFRLGADQYVPKPYTPDQIFQALDDASAWHRDGHRREGEIPFGSDDEGEALRRIGQLRSLLLADSPLGPDASGRVAEALAALWASADAWGRAHGAARVASLSYRLLPDCLVLSLRDLSGWFRDDDRPPEERWPEAAAAGRFDEVFEEQSGGPVVFVTRFPGTP
jgi:CheY-like chemotaxis protein